MYNDNDKDKKKKGDGSFNKEEFKHAIAMIESSGGKYLDSKTSSAAGKYHFIYEYIKGDPDMEGVSKRAFINNPELQEKIMDKALSGTLKDYVSYPKWASKLKSQFDTDLSITEIAALTHFMGAGGARSYLRNPSEYKVPGVNATPEQYVERYRKYSTPKEKDGQILENTPQREYSPRVVQSMQKQKDGVNLSQTQRQSELPMQQDSGLEVRRDENIDISALPDGIGDAPVKTGVIPLSDQVEGGTPSGAKFLSEMVNIPGGKDVIPFAMGGNTEQPLDLNQPQVIEFKEGGTHEQNPHGGIPIGMGANGKMNTVEEGETKFGDYIFSNRINLDGTSIKSDIKRIEPNQYAEGGDVDPLNKAKPIADQQKTVDAGLNFNKNWMMDPITGDKMARNAGVQDKPYIDRAQNALLNAESNKSIRQKGVNDMMSTTQRFNQTTPNKNENAYYQPATNSISHYQDARDTDAVHEGLHASKLDKDGDKYIKENFGSPIDSYIKRSGAKTLVDAIAKNEGIKDKTSIGGANKIAGIAKHIQGLSKGDEVYPRVMEIRRFLNVKPGQEITPEMIKKAKKESGVDLFNYYGEEEVRNILNTVASNDSKSVPQQEYRLS